MDRQGRRGGGRVHVREHGQRTPRVADGAALLRAPGEARGRRASAVEARCVGPPWIHACLSPSLAPASCPCASRCLAGDVGRLQMGRCSATPLLRCWTRQRHAREHTLLFASSPCAPLLCPSVVLARPRASRPSCAQSSSAEACDRDFAAERGDRPANAERPPTWTATYAGLHSALPGTTAFSSRLPRLHPALHPHPHTRPVRPYPLPSQPSHPLPFLPPWSPPPSPTPSPLARSLCCLPTRARRLPASALRSCRLTAGSHGRPQHV